jgi:hypothetical protein
MKKRPGDRGIVVQCPEMATDLYLYQGVQTSHAVYPDYYLVGSIGGFSGGKASGACMYLITHLHPVLRLRMSGAVPTFPSLFFMAGVRTTLPLRWQLYFVSDRTWLRFSNRRQMFLTSFSCCGDPRQKLSYNLQLARVFYLLPVFERSSLSHVTLQTLGE